MLVLSRKLGQQVVLSFNGIPATVEVLQIDGNRIRLGIAAPADVQIKRGELVASESRLAEAMCYASPTALLAFPESPA